MMGEAMEVSIAPLELYWKPGCTSCQRMKEFVAKTGHPYVAYNIDVEPERGFGLDGPGLRDPRVPDPHDPTRGMLMLPLAARGGRIVSGLDLAAISELIGFDYQPHTPLPPAELLRRYRIVVEALCRYMAQMTDEGLAYELPGRRRPLLHFATQSASVGRSFLAAYDDHVHDKAYYRPHPAQIQTSADVIARAHETLRLVDEWWERDGFDDPLDAVIETYWGHRTLHEVWEREVWHTAQHVRQVAYVLEQLGIEPDGPLTPEDLAGLPIPEGIYD
jgi:hypothetical protein